MRLGQVGSFRVQRLVLLELAVAALLVGWAAGPLALVPAVVVAAVLVLLAVVRRRGRPLPEWLRESYFLKLHARAERGYDPRPYAGEILIFSGEGMYDDVTLGWAGLAQGGVRTYVVPGEHKDNRDMMRPHHVGYVADILLRYCEDGTAQGDAGGAAALDLPTMTAAP